MADADRVAFMGMWQRSLFPALETALAHRPPDVVPDGPLALRVVETLRGMATADRMQAALHQVEHARVTPLAGRARELSDQIDALEACVRKTADRHPGLEGARQRAELRQQQRDLDATWRDVMQQLERESPGYAQLQRPNPIALDALRAVLPCDTAYITFALGEKGSFLLLVDQLGFRHWRLPKRELIENAVAAHLRRLGNAASGSRVLKTGSRLYALLLKPAEKALARYEVLLVSPEGVLNGLPLGTLVTEQTNDFSRARFLAKTHDILYVNSATVWKIHCDRARKRQGEFESGKKTPATRALVLGDPIGTGEKGWDGSGGKMSILIEDRRSGYGRLPHTRREALGVLRRFSGTKGYEYRVTVDGKEITPARLQEVLARAESPSPDVRHLTVKSPEVEVRLGSAAGRKSFIATKLDPYRFIHIACHGHINERAPGLSALVLSPVKNDSGY